MLGRENRRIEGHRSCRGGKKAEDDLRSRQAGKRGRSGKLAKAHGEEPQVELEGKC